MDGFHSAFRRISAATMVVVALGSGVSVALAGMRIDLRPDPPIPPGGYEPNAIVDIRVYYVDTGNPQGNIQFRGLFLDFNDSPPWGDTPGTFTYLGDNPAPSHPGDDLYFTWVQSFGIGTWPLLPNPAWIYPLATPQPLFQITLPDNGEVYAGHIYVNLGSAGGTLDVMNDDVADPSFGARADFGFGGPNDPVTTWRAYTGELTGGVLDLPVVPEPASAVLVGIGLVCVTWARRERGRWRNGGSYGGPGLRSNAPTGHRLTAQGWLDASRVYPGSTAGPAATLSGLWRFDVRAPRVAASRQPWAGGRNTFGVVRGSASSLVTRAPHRNSAPSPPRSCALRRGLASFVPRQLASTSLFDRVAYSLAREEENTMNTQPRSVQAWICGVTISAFLFCSSPPALAGMRIDLRPDPPIPPGGYEPNTNLRMDVYFVDTGNPQTQILFRGLFLDLSDMPPWGDALTDLRFYGQDGIPNNWDDDDVSLELQFGLGDPPPSLPWAAWVYPLATPNPLFQYRLPDNGEFLFGHFYVNVGAVGGMLDVMNDTVADPNFGARADFGFGGPNDPVTTWRAYTGELTGGVLELPVVPEPASVLLVGIGLVYAWRTRRKTR